MTKAKIMVVDDSEETLTLLRKRLESQNYEVVTGIASGQEAISLAKEVQPDLILMDVKLSGKMTGIEAADTIRKNMDVPVIYISAFSDDDTLQDAIQTEPFSYILKPYNGRELLGNIEIALYKHQIAMKLKASQQELAETNQRLELVVEERTAELQMAFELMKKKADRIKKSNKKLESALKEREFLLKEIHDRVKDNMQLITSLLGLQASKTQDDTVIHELQDTISRVKAMSFAHEILYRSKDFAKISISEYIEKLVGSLFEVHSDKMERVGKRLEIGDFKFDIDTVITLGLILNEIVGNSLSYAFPEDQTGEVFVEILSDPDSDESIILRVGDTGVGCPMIDFEKVNSLGLSLIRNLVQSNLEGSIQLDSEKGVCYTIKFKAPDY